MENNQRLDVFIPSDGEILSNLLCQSEKVVPSLRVLNLARASDSKVESSRRAKVGRDRLTVIIREIEKRPDGHLDRTF